MASLMMMMVLLLLGASASLPATWLLLSHIPHPPPTCMLPPPLPAGVPPQTRPSSHLGALFMPRVSVTPKPGLLPIPTVNLSP